MPFVMEPVSLVKVFRCSGSDLHHTTEGTTGENSTDFNMCPLQIVQVQQTFMYISPHCHASHIFDCFSSASAGTEILTYASQYALFHCWGTSPSSEVYRRTVNSTGLPNVMLSGVKCTWARKSTLNISPLVLFHSCCTITMGFCKN
jgi:hypothetical protein